MSVIAPGSVAKPDFDTERFAFVPACRSLGRSKGGSAPTDVIVVRTSACRSCPRILCRPGAARVGGIDSQDAGDRDGAAADSAHRCRVALVCPGNPGLANFYPEFAAFLTREVAKRDDDERLCCVYCISLAGHELAPRCTPAGVQYDCNDQIEHKIAVVEHLARQHAGAVPATVWVIAHSIGSYFMHNAMRLRPTLPVTRLIALFPWLRFDATPALHLSNRLFFLLHPLLVLGLSRLGKLSVESIGKVISGATGGTYGSEVVGIISRALATGPELLNNCLYLGEDEFNSVPHEFDVDSMIAQKGRLSVVFGREDAWGPIEQYHDLRAAAPDLEVILAAEKVTHDFCTHRAQAHYVAADVVAPLLREESAETLGNVIRSRL